MQVQETPHFVDTARSHSPESALLVAAGPFVAVALVGEGLGVGTTVGDR
jgi:hypothetical protein